MKKIGKYGKICKQVLAHFIHPLSKHRYQTFVQVGKFNLKKYIHLHINLSPSKSIKSVH